MKVRSGSRSAYVATFGLAALLIGLALAGCGPRASSDPPDSGGSGPPNTPPGDDEFGIDASPDFCAGDHYTAEPVPLAIIVMLDQSGSMSDAAVGGGTLWSRVADAIVAFVESPDTAGIGIGLQYFPVPNDVPCTPCGTCSSCINGCCAVPTGDPCGPTCSSGLCINGSCAEAPGDSCELADYAEPDVPIGVLPGAAPAVVASLSSRTPNGGTPMGVALAGAIDYATSWVATNPTHEAVVVLATDGDPTSCTPSTVPEIADLAAAAAAATPPIRTFVIGVGDGLTDLHTIAAAGDTDMAFLVDTDADAGDQFLEAMQIIRGAALSCEFLIPEPDSGVPDFDKVNVEVTPGGGGAPVTIPRVPDAASCTAAGGWYYDDPANPTRILLCPESCNEFQGDPNAEVEILIGCETIVL